MAFRKATANKIGIKFLGYGKTGSGKSYFQMTFPKVACIDSEVGIAHYEGKNITLNNGKTYNNLVMVDDTSDLDDLEDDIDELIDSDAIETLSIDSETKFYNTMQVAATEVEERKARKKGGDVDDTVVSQRQWGRIKIINMKLQQAKIDLSSKGKHVVSIAQAKELYEGNGDDRKFIGLAPDMAKGVAFDYDVVLEFYSEEQKDGSFKYFAKVKKDRTNVTKLGQIIENPCYDIWADYYNGMEKLDNVQTSYKSDIKNSTESMLNDAEKASELSDEWKELMKQVKESGKDATEISNFIKEKSINVKALDTSSVETLTSLIELTKSVLA